MRLARHPNEMGFDHMTRKSTSEIAEDIVDGWKERCDLERGDYLLDSLEASIQAALDAERAAEPTAGSEWPSEEQVDAHMKAIEHEWVGYQHTEHQLFRGGFAACYNWLKANYPEIPEGSTAGSERDLGMLQAFEEIENIFVGDEDARQVMEYAHERAAEIKRHQPAPTAQPDDRLELAIKALEDVNLRFMAMGNATIEHGLPSAKELIQMCEQSALACQAVLEQIAAKTKERG